MNGTSMATPVAAGSRRSDAASQHQTDAEHGQDALDVHRPAACRLQHLRAGRGPTQYRRRGARRETRAHRSGWQPPLVGAPLLTTTTATAGQDHDRRSDNLRWSQGIILNRNYAKGTNLITKYQKIYGLGVLLGDGVLLSDGVLLGDGVLLSDGVLLGDSIVTASGVLLGDGGLLCSAGVLLGDGVLLSDGVLLE